MKTITITENLRDGTVEVEPPEASPGEYVPVAEFRRLAAQRDELLVELVAVRDFLLAVQIGSPNPITRAAIQTHVNWIEVVIVVAGGPPVNSEVREVANVTDEAPSKPESGAV